MTPARDDVEPASLQAHFETLVRRRAADFIGEVLARGLALPELAKDQTERAWLPVPGMFGGFGFQMCREGEALMLIVESESRVVAGSGQRHVVTGDGATRLDSGIVPT